MTSGPGRTGPHGTGWTDTRQEGLTRDGAGRHCTGQEALIRDGAGRHVTGREDWIAAEAFSPMGQGPSDCSECCVSLLDGMYGVRAGAGTASWMMKLERVSSDDYLRLSTAQR